MTDKTTEAALIDAFIHIPGATVDGMQLLIDMRDRDIAAAKEIAFFKAFTGMQAEIPAIAKTGDIKDNSGKVRSRYALFEDINEAVKPVLAKHGFGLFFKEEITPNEIRVTLVIFHEAGHKLEWGAVLPADNSGAKSPIQAIGSSVSYMKRYLMIGALNVTTCGEDDDGVASNVGKKPTPPKDEPAAETAQFAQEWADGLTAMQAAKTEEEVKRIGTQMFNKAKEAKNRVRMNEVAAEVDKCKKALADKSQKQVGSALETAIAEIKSEASAGQAKNRRTVDKANEPSMSVPVHEFADARG